MPGANNSASGVALLLETARALHAQKTAAGDRRRFHLLRRRGRTDFAGRRRSALAAARLALFHRASRRHLSRREARASGDLRHGVLARDEASARSRPRCSMPPTRSTNSGPSAAPSRRLSSAADADAAADLRRPDRAQRRAYSGFPGDRLRNTIRGSTPRRTRPINARKPRWTVSAAPPCGIFTRTELSSRRIDHHGRASHRNIGLRRAHGAHAGRRSRGDAGLHAVGRRRRTVEPRSRQGYRRAGRYRRGRVSTPAAMSPPCSPRPMS